MKSYLKEMSVGEVIDGSVRIYLHNFGTFFLIYLLPVIVAEIYVLSSTDPAGTVTFHGVASNIVKFAAVMFASAAITVAVSDACLGQKPGVARSYRRLFDVIGKFLLTYLLLMVLFIVAFALLVVPGLIAIALFLFATIVVILERRQGMEALKRSMALGKGYYWRNMGILLLTVIMVFVGQVILFFVAGSLIYMFDDVDRPGFFAQLLVALISNALGPIPLIATVLLYYDVRVRKENYDTAALAQDLVG